MFYQQENFSKSYHFRIRKHDGFIIGAHIHEFSEWLFVEKGVADIRINRKAYRIPEKHLIFIPPNYVHEYACVDTKVICAVFSNDFIPLFFQKLGSRKLLCEPIDFSQKEEIIRALYEADTTEPIRLCGWLNLIAASVMENARLLDGEPADSVLYQKVVSYLSEHYAENITLLSLSRTFGYNEKYLSSALHSLTGVNFRRLLDMYRIEQAKKLLLRHGELKVTDIAFQCGYSALNTFNRAFKAFTGRTPSQYKNRPLNE